MWGFETQRYGAYLIAPLALAIAFAARGLIVPGAERGTRPATFWLQQGIALASAIALLSGLKLYYFDPAIPNDGRARWALARNPQALGAMERAVEIMERESPTRPTLGNRPARLVIAADWWAQRPIEYLSLGRGTLAVCAYDALAAPPDRRPRLVLDS